MADQADNRGLPLRPGHLAKPVGAPSPPGEQEGVPISAPRGNEVDIRTMIVGAEIGFTGESRSCNRLVVEGTVEGKLDNCQHIIIEESGVFRGETSTENADVRGSFDGVLVARKRLLIRATGRVSGTITYAEIEIEPGGRVSGTLQGHGEIAMLDARRVQAAKALAATHLDRRSARPEKDA